MFTSHRFPSQSLPAQVRSRWIAPAVVARWRIQVTSLTLILVSLIGILFTARIGIAQDSEVPFEAVVNDRTASVYSGPGDVHYVTDRLAIGRRVEVYRIDPDGWLAIRPPKGSFSLIPSTAVTRTEQPGVGRIVVDDVKAWVGTRLDTPAQPLWQVRLQKNELVAVIGQQPPGQNPNDVTWTRIEPPAGEFRWIRAADVTRFVPVDVSSHEGPSESPARVIANDASRKSTPSSEQVDDSRQEIQLASNEHAISEGEPTKLSHSPAANEQQPPRIPATLSAELRSQSAPLDGSNATTDSAGSDANPTSTNSIAQGTEVATDTNPGDGFVGRQPTSTDPENVGDAELAESTQTSETTQSSPGPNPQLIELTNPAGQTLQLSFSDAVRNLELQMTRMTTYPVEKWDTRGLHFLAKQLADQSTSDSQRARVAQMLEKLDEFDELHTKRIALAQMMTDAKPIGTGVDTDNPVYQQTLDEDDPEAAEEARLAMESYAGTGYLNRLITEHGLGKGGYVLQDKDGRIVFIVVPAPGVNLERYLSKHVAVQGGTSPSRQFNKPLITADRVIQLDRFR